jgi:hypothetical protein
VTPRQHFEAASDLATFDEWGISVVPRRPRSAVPLVGPMPTKRRPGLWFLAALGLSLAVEVGVGAMLVLEFCR